MIFSLSLFLNVYTNVLIYIYIYDNIESIQYKNYHEFENPTVTSKYTIYKTCLLDFLSLLI